MRCMERSDHIAFVVCKHDRLKNKARALSEYLGVDLRAEPNKTDVEKYLKYGRDYYLSLIHIWTLPTKRIV